jgi:hypothetical protein
VKMNTHHPRVALAALGVVTTLGLLPAGCGPRTPPVDPAAQARESLQCRHCTESNCASEAAVCEADPARAQAEDGTRCLCLVGCRLQHHTAAACVAHCGAADAASTALASCWDASCADRCAPNPKETP